MGHDLSTNMQYSKHIGVKRLNKNPANEPAKVEKSIIKRNEKRSINPRQASTVWRPD